MKRIIYFIIIAPALSMSLSCSRLNLDEVVTDKRTEYLKSRDLPALEIPPDLTSDTINESMAIPGEEEATTLSEFEQQKARKLSEGSTETESVESTESAEAVEFEDEQRLTVKGSSLDVWLELRKFWMNKGYRIDLDDAELGVMETEWRENSEGVRDKFRIFSEPGEDETMLVLFISSEREQKNKDEWAPVARDTELEKAIVEELNMHFQGVALLKIKEKSNA